MSRYYVHFIDDVPVVTHGPYDLTTAKQFARIGSEHGESRRAVTRGKDGDIVRVYADGYRQWPLGETEIAEAGLRQSEKPNKSVPYLPPEKQHWVENPLGIWVEPVRGYPGVFAAHHLTEPIGFVYWDRRKGWTAQGSVEAVEGFHDFDTALVALREMRAQQEYLDAGETAPHVPVAKRAKSDAWWED